MDGHEKDENKAKNKDSHGRASEHRAGTGRQCTADFVVWWCRWNKDAMFGSICHKMIPTLAVPLYNNDSADNTDLSKFASV